MFFVAKRYVGRQKKTTNEILNFAKCDLYMYDLVDHSFAWAFVQSMSSKNQMQTPWTYITEELKLFSGYRISIYKYGEIQRCERKDDKRGIVDSMFRYFGAAPTRFA